MREKQGKNSPHKWSSFKEMAEVKEENHIVVLSSGELCI